MHTTEHTDLDGDALTIHRDKGLAWITLTRGGEELTVGPVHATALAAHDHPGGLGASEWKILAETYGRDLERFRDDTELAEEFAALWKETARRAIQSERDQVDLAEQWATTAQKVERERDELREKLAAAEQGPDDAAQRERDEAPAVDYPAMWWKAEREREKAERERDEARARADAAESRPLSPEALTDEMCRRAADEFDRTRSWERALIAALTEPSQRPDWLDAPAVRAWHKNDGRTEHDGTPGKPRIWSPDYGKTETWSTPSLREVPWTDLVDVEPLDVSAELAEGLDRVAEFMRTGGVRVVGEDGAA